MRQRQDLGYLAAQQCPSFPRRCERDGVRVRDRCYHLPILTTTRDPQSTSPTSLTPHPTLPSSEEECIRPLVVGKLPATIRHTVARRLCSVAMTFTYFCGRLSIGREPQSAHFRRPRSGVRCSFHLGCARWGTSFSSQTFSAKGSLESACSSDGSAHRLWVVRVSAGNLRVTYCLHYVLSRNECSGCSGRTWPGV